MIKWCHAGHVLALSPLIASGALPTVAEGPGVVSTESVEVRGSISPDGQRIVWGSTNRSGGPGGWDLWQARRHSGNWVDAQPLSIDTMSKEFDPAFSPDGFWLYFFSDRPGGFGGDDLYRSAILADGSFGAVENLGEAVNTRGDEWAPTLSADGNALLYASNGRADSRRHDLYIATWNGTRFDAVAPVPGINTPADEFDAAWLANGRGLLFARSENVDEKPIRLWLAHCDGHAYRAAQAWSDPLNRIDGYTLGPALDPQRKETLLVTALMESAGKSTLDIVRVAMPPTTGRDGCVAPPGQPSRSQRATSIAK
ncbi:MAG: TolB-like protein [Tahibacter sp.]